MSNLTHFCSRHFWVIRPVPSACLYPIVLKAFLGKLAMLILGVDPYHGDVSAILVCASKLIAAVEEERFHR